MLSHVTSHLILLPSISEWGYDIVSLKHTHTFIPCKEINQTQLSCRNLLFWKAQRGITAELCSNFATQSPSATSFNPFLPPATYIRQNRQFPQSESVIIWPTSSLLGQSVPTGGTEKSLQQDVSMLHAVKYSVGYKFVVLLKQAENTAAFKIKLC